MKIKILENYLVECETGKKAKLKTKILFEHDEKNLYFHFECEQIFRSPKYFHYNEPLFEGDIVEVLITLDERKKYLEIEANQNNSQYSVIIYNKDGKGNIEITKIDKSNFCSTIKELENFWSCDIILAKENLKKLGWNENDFFINFHRQDFDKNNNMNLYSLQPTFCRKFHITSAMKHINLGGRN